MPVEGVAIRKLPVLEERGGVPERSWARLESSTVKPLWFPGAPIGHRGPVVPFPHDRPCAEDSVLAPAGEFAPRNRGLDRRC